ncbi:F-box/FBD/LRR-repeat protein At5g56420-like [Nicotiana tomentosiformis]|uniref:F-box/FBD/LRR-repeat protein At5g56420-like n=1 Tax=Nicotiana tomentosiformis TaxID=4098 RepID=UPI00388CA21F
MEEKSMDPPVDHISKLPVPVLQKILSSFLAKDVAQLSTLSKSLNSAWSSLSYLNFSSKFFYHQGDDDQWILSENITELVNIVDQILVNRQNQKISIQKFCYIHGWINTLVSLNIKELTLSIDTPDDGYNTLPEAIFVAKELNVLNLQGFKLELPHNGIKFSSLRVLHLSKTLLSDHFIRAVCESCSDLEDLKINECRGLASLQIGGTLSKLRSVWLDCLYDLQMVDIVASNLENLHIDWMLEVIGITACKSLKRLYLHHLQ